MTTVLKDSKQALLNSDVDYHQLLQNQTKEEFQGFVGLSKDMKELNRRIFRGFEYGRH